MFLSVAAETSVVFDRIVGKGAGVCMSIVYMLLTRSSAHVFANYYCFQGILSY